MKHIVLFPIPPQWRWVFTLVMFEIENITGIPAPCRKLIPHVSMHRPLHGIDEEVLLNLVRSMALQIRRTRITMNSLYPFGKEYVVMPVQATRNVAALWVGLGDLLARLPEFVHGPYDGDNTLLLTVADGLSHVFDSAWPKIRQMQFESVTVPLENIALYRKPDGGTRWEEVAKFHLSK